MSAISNIGRSLLGMHTNRDRQADPLARLRFAIETMPGTRKYLFSPNTRLEVLSELYAAFWGPYSDLFLPNSAGQVSGLLSEAQKLAQRLAEDDEPPIPGKPCGRIFKKGDSCYRCRDCAIDDSTVLCSRCFNQAHHTNHNVTFYVAVQPGGVCDCGEQEAWKASPGCQIHIPPESTTQATPKAPTARSAAMVDQWSLRNRATVPHELRETMSRTVAYALDFVLDTLDFSPSELSLPATEADMRKVPTSDPLMTELYAIVVWNDEKHSYDESVSHIRDSVGTTTEAAAQFVERIDSEGRAIVVVSQDTPRIYSEAKQIAGIEMAVTLRRAYDTFREQVSAVIVEWLMDLMQSRLMNDPIILREVLAAEVYAPRKKDSSSLTSNQEATKVLAEIKDPARLDWLFLYHSKLWKRVRLNLKRIFVSMLTINHEHRLTVAVHFASVYHRIIDTYLLVDREAESSIKYFSVQIFTVPSVAAYIVRHHSIITRLLSIITSFFTNNIQSKRILHPPDPARRVEVESYPFKSKRFMPVFSDLRYLCTNRTIQELIAHNHDYLAQFIPVCQIFMGINPNKRAVTNHVEYETESWISVFNVTLSLSRVVKIYGEAFALASSTNLVYAIIAVLHAILSTCTLSNDQLDKTKYFPILFHTVPFGDSEYQIIHFDVLAQWVSFHHSLHWLLAELLKHVHLLNDQPLREIILLHASERAVLTVIDFPLRVVTMVAQIRTGLWVRNGFAIRGQLLHYRDFMLRELCYDQDLFIIQSAFVILDPNVVLVSILDRFRLTKWFSGDVKHSAYDGTQLFTMVEEVLYVIITCLSESANARRLSPLEIVRREIIHGLALGACPFTELCKRVAERIVDDCNLDRALSMIANYKAPISSTDYGLYELKDEYFDEVNPFFFHYTRNRREEAESVLKARLTKRTGSSTPIIVPKPFGATFGPFVSIPQIFNSEVLLQIMFFSIRNVFLHAEASGSLVSSGDAILDQALHLTMLALVEQPTSFSNMAVTLVVENEKMTYLEMLCKLEVNDALKTFKPKVQWCLDEMLKYQPAMVGRYRMGSSHLQPVTDAEDAKKRAAKARQAMIMQDFAKAQQAFLLQYEDEDEDLAEDGEDGAIVEALGPCIVCQDELDATQSFGILGFIQPSRVIKRTPEPRWDILERVLQCPPSLDRPSTSVSLASDGPTLPSPPGVAPFGIAPSEETRFGLYGSVCGHLMHTECFGVYINSVEQRHLQQPTRNHPEVVERKEFLCPLCKSLGNIVIPLIPRPKEMTDRSDPLLWSTSHLKSMLPLGEWMRKSQTDLLVTPVDRARDSLQLLYTGEFVFWAAEDVAPSGQAIDVRTRNQQAVVESIDNIIRPLSVQTPHLRDRMEPAPGLRGRGLYLPQDFVAYTINAAEIAQRGSGMDGTSLLENTNDSTVIRMIRGLVAYLAKRSEFSFSTRPDKGRQAIRHGILTRLLPSAMRDRNAMMMQPLMLRDPFVILVETAAVAPEILPHVVVLAYFLCMARTAVGLVDFLSQLQSNGTVPRINSSCPELFGDSVAIFVQSVCRHSPVLEQMAEGILSQFGEGLFERLLYAHTLPFLRSASLLLGAVLPSRTTTKPTSSLPEYHRILQVLNIPPLSEISADQNEALRSALATWCEHFGMHFSSQPRHCAIILDWPGVHYLALLPNILDAVFTNDAQALVCPRCETTPTDPAICLFCGTVCCHQSHCCLDEDDRKQGECNMHMRECAGAVGLYFLVKRCMVLHLYAGSGSFAQPPYLDVHGEFDYMMRRGRRQYLHIPRYEELRKTWLNHSIPTFIARKLDGSMDSGGWDSV